MGNEFWFGDMKKTSHAVSLYDGILSSVDTRSTLVLRPSYENLTDWDNIGNKRVQFLTFLDSIKS